MVAMASFFCVLPSRQSRPCGTLSVRAPNAPLVHGRWTHARVQSAPDLAPSHPSMKVYLTARIGLVRKAIQVADAKVREAQAEFVSG